MTKDVNTAWRTLYERQAPLLTWPEGVQERFQSWGRQWPEKVNPKKIELAIVDYIEAYPAYVDMVYKTFNPFNYETGEGVVAAPPEAELLLPAQFSQEHLPDLGKIWAAQERLWIQRTVLEVIAEVNKNAKKWDEAVIRQIVSLEVGSPDAQDQRSLAKNETLEESKGIYAPGEEPAGRRAPVQRLGEHAGGGGRHVGRHERRRRSGGGGDMMGGMMGGMAARAGTRERLLRQVGQRQVQGSPAGGDGADRPGSGAGFSDRAGKLADVDPGQRLRAGASAVARHQAREG